MKTLTILSKTILILALMGLFSCSEEIEQPAPAAKAILQFENEQLQLQENGAEQEVTVTLHKPASQEGLLTIELDTVSARYKTDATLVGRKFELAIARGQQKVRFKILPSNNQTADGNLNVKISIASVTDGFVIGAKKVLRLSLLDDDIQQPTQSAISFANTSSTLLENAGAGLDVSIQFSNPIASAGSFVVELTALEANHNLHYTTLPAAENGRISFTPAIGSTSASIKIMPVNNDIVSGEVQLTLSIATTSGSVIKGETVSHQLLIKDDELMNLPKGYSISGILGQKRTYEYDQSGRISKVLIQSGNTSSTEAYFYDANGRIERINSHPEMNRVFIWKDNRIVRSERIEFDVLKQYIEYDYDAQGNVSGTANYFRQPNGEYLLSFVVVYLYLTDNNLYKSLYYLPAEGEEEFILHSTRTYENYLDSENPFPMVEILPGIKTQTKLPGTFRLEENGQDLLYRLSYEFLEDGRVSKRFAQNSNQIETTEYYYY
jgi:hypothetical protein